MNSKPGRNDPCWCGSGKKYKKCHLPLDENARLVSAPQAEESDAPVLDYAPPAPRWSPVPKDTKDVADVFKFFANSGLAKREPELRRILEDHQPLLQYLEQQPEIDAALKQLEPYEKDFKRLCENEAAFHAQCEKLFDGEPFAPLRFTAADVERAFQNVGYPPSVAPQEHIYKSYLKAMLFLTKERRGDFTLQLLVRLPTYVQQGRFMDAHLILFASDATSEFPDEPNPFLLRMFVHGLEPWLAQREQTQQSILRELGFAAGKKLTLDEMEAWITQNSDDPVKTARLQQIIDRHPTLFGASTDNLNAWHSEMHRLFDHPAAECLLLDGEELEPCLPRLFEMLAKLSDQCPLSKGKPSQAQQEKAFSIILPAIREVVQGIFTPPRLQKLLTELREFRNKVLASGDNMTAFWALTAINYLQHEDNPSLNSFLIHLCYRSLMELTPGPSPEQEDYTGEDSPPSPSASEPTV